MAYISTNAQIKVAIRFQIKNQLNQKRKGNHL